MRNYIQEYQDKIESGEIVVGEFIRTLYGMITEGIANGKVISVNEQKAGNLFIVTDGLEGGEEIVAEGAGMVKENQKVK